MIVAGEAGTFAPWLTREKLEVTVQNPFVIVTVYVPAISPEISCVVAPFDQLYILDPDNPLIVISIIPLLFPQLGLVIEARTNGLLTLTLTVS